MREIRTSGLTSGDGKRGVAAWPKPPRPSSTLQLRFILIVSAIVAALAGYRFLETSPLDEIRQAPEPPPRVDDDRSGEAEALVIHKHYHTPALRHLGRGGISAQTLT